MTGPRQGYRLQHMSVCILPQLYRHSIVTSTPRRMWHRVAKVSKNSAITRMAEKCMKTPSAHSASPSPVQLGPENAFLSSKSKTRAIVEKKVPPDLGLD